MSCSTVFGVVFFTLLAAGLCALLYVAGGPAKAPGIVIAIAFVAILARFIREFHGPIAAKPDFMRL